MRFFKRDRSDQNALFTLRQLDGSLESPVRLYRGDQFNITTASGEAAIRVSLQRDAWEIAILKPFADLDAATIEWAKRQPSAPPLPRPSDGPYQVIARG